MLLPLFSRVIGGVVSGIVTGVIKNSGGGVTPVVVPTVYATEDLGSYYYSSDGLSNYIIET